MSDRCPALTEVCVGTFRDAGDLYLRCEGRAGHLGRHNHRRMRSWRNGEPGTVVLVETGDRMRETSELRERVEAAERALHLAGKQAARSWRAHRDLYQSGRMEAYCDAVRAIRAALAEPAPEDTA